LQMQSWKIAGAGQNVFSGAAVLFVVLRVRYFQRQTAESITVNPQSVTEQKASFTDQIF